MTGSAERLVDDWLAAQEAAELLDLSVNKLRQLAREHQLLLVRRDGATEPSIPAGFIQDGMIVKGLGGTLTLLADRGLSEEEALEWLFTSDDSLPGRPVDALRADRGKEVRRRAQVIV